MYSCYIEIQQALTLTYAKRNVLVISSLHYDSTKNLYLLNNCSPCNNVRFDEILDLFKLPQIYIFM